MGDGKRGKESLIWREVVVQLEVISDQGSHISPLLHQFEQEWHELHQLVVRSVNKPGLDGNAVLQLIPECLRGVVDDDCLGQVPAEDIQILDVVAIDTDTMLSEQSAK